MINPQSPHFGTLVLPWPAKGLSPNGRLHWASLKKLKAKAKSDAAWSAKAAGWREIKEPCRLLVRVRFNPPDKRRRDIDNAFASLKAAFDGLSDVLGVDDSKWAFDLAAMGEPVKGGQVLVTVFTVPP